MILGSEDCPSPGRHRYFPVPLRITPVGLIGEQHIREGMIPLHRAVVTDGIDQTQLIRRFTQHIRRLGELIDSSILVCSLPELGNRTEILTVLHREDFLNAIDHKSFLGFDSVIHCDSSSNG
ncbi:hypothetical protein D1872_300830 [compost metagenome]